MSENNEERTENALKAPESETQDLRLENADSPNAGSNTLLAWIIALAVIGAIGLVGSYWIFYKSADTSNSTETAEATQEEHDEHEEGREITLDSEELTSAGIEIETVTERPAIAKLYVPGTVELNPEQTEMATPLVSGRIERVFYSVGDRVRRGAVLATISSPLLAQMHGKLHEARTAYELALRNLERVQKSENRVAVLQSKAKLDEAEKTLNRTKRLIELGAGAGKDLIAAETTYNTAKAEYEFQSNITLNKEIQEAKAAVETSRVDLHHIQDEMRALGVFVDISKPDNHAIDTSIVELRAPLSGVITERRSNAGAGVEANVPIFAISNTSTIYVIANVPEANLNKLLVGSNVEIRSPSFGTANGFISYIDPSLDEGTRTGKVRVELQNPGGKLKAGMFTEVGFSVGVNPGGGSQLAVNSEAIQTDGDKTIVFLPKDDEPGAFEVREIETGGEFEGYTSVKSGLKLGEKVVTKGSFTLKTQMKKGEMGDHGH